MRRTSLGVAVVALLVVATVIVVRRVGGGGPIEFRWVALGDSYSSGLGEIDRPLECARDVNASYAGRAAGLLRSRGYGVTLQLHACSSARLDHVFVPQSASTIAQIDNVDATVDVVTFTFGGDDIGFGNIVSTCVVTHYGSRLSVLLGVGDSIARDCAVDPDNPINAGDGEDGWTGVEDEFVKVITAVRSKMSPTGQVFVLSYPVVFADPDTWRGAGCHGFTPENARSFNLGVIRMGDAMDRAVRRADTLVPGVRFVDWRETKSEDVVWARHGLCGDDAAWVHGLRVLEPGGFTTSPANSFHPTAVGYAAAAELLSKAIDDAL